MVPFQCYYCCYHQFWLVDLIGWPKSVVESDWLVGWGSHRLLIGLLELDLFWGFLFCPVLLLTLGLFCTHPNSYDMTVLVGLMEYFFWYKFFGIIFFWHKSMKYKNRTTSTSGYKKYRWKFWNVKCTIFTQLRLVTLHRKVSRYDTWHCDNRPFWWSWLSVSQCYVWHQ